MARVVRDSDGVYHRKDRGSVARCGAQGCRPPRPGEIEGRRLRQCGTCYGTSPKGKAAKEERHDSRMDELRPLVLARAGYRCERCGARATAAKPLAAHHRLMRSQGGPDTMENLVCLCGLDNHHGCHGWVHRHPTEAYALGLLIRQSDGPPAEPWEPPPGEYGADFWG